MKPDEGTVEMTTTALHDVEQWLCVRERRDETDEWDYVPESSEVDLTTPLDYYDSIVAQNAVEEGDWLAVSHIPPIKRGWHRLLKKKAAVSYEGEEEEEREGGEGQGRGDKEVVATATTTATTRTITTTATRTGNVDQGRVKGEENTVDRLVQATARSPAKNATKLKATPESHPAALGSSDDTCSGDGTTTTATTTTDTTDSEHRDPSSGSGSGSGLAEELDRPPRRRRRLIMPLAYLLNQDPETGAPLRPLRYADIPAFKVREVGPPPPSTFSW